MRNPARANTDCIALNSRRPGRLLSAPTYGHIFETHRRLAVADYPDLQAQIANLRNQIGMDDEQKRLNALRVAELEQPLYQIPSGLW
jgi:hypothetical protein